MMQDKLKHFMFARMLYRRHIVAALDNFNMEFFVVGDIQFLFVVKESVEFFPLEKVVNQSARAFLTKYFKGLDNFNFAIRAISNLLFMFRRFGKGSGGKCNKAIGVKNQLVPIVLGIHNLEACRTRERVGNTIFLAQLMN
jgi:hypothetical protein